MSERKEEEAQKMALDLMPLLKEYTEKVRKLGAQVSEFQQVSRSAMEKRDQQLNQRQMRHFEAWRFGFMRIMSALTQLIQQASQLVNHGKIEPITKLELSLRGAELEAALNEAETFIHAGPDG